MTRTTRARISTGLRSYWRQVHAVQRITEVSTPIARATVRALRAREIRSAYATTQHPIITARAARAIATTSVTPTFAAAIADMAEPPDTASYATYADAPEPPGDLDDLDEFERISDHFDDGTFDDYDDIETEANADYEETP